MFSVWAPFAQNIELVLDRERRERHPMIKSDHGWWWSSSVQSKEGLDYAFSIDGNDPLPDPRSPWQPHGVHDFSRTVGHGNFPWTDRGWQAPPLSAAVVYELHIGTFTPEGTFDAAIKRLDHLANLGVTHVEIMPVAQFEGRRGWGYDGVSLYAPHRAYGGPEGLKRFVNACHEKGLAVLLDVVYNHLGPSGNYLPRFGPYFTDRHTTPWGPAINFDGAWSDQVRRFFCDNALMWLRDYHIDGLRLDAIHAIVDTSAIPFIEQLATEVDELKAHLGRHLVLIAESDLNDPRIVRPWEIGGFGIDAQWSDDIHHALHTVLTGEREGYYADFGSLADLAMAMRQPYVYAGRHSSYRQRRHGRPAVGLSAHCFLAYIQNHDQLGNRAQGDRISHLVNEDRVKIGAALVLTSPFVPMLFQGEEWSAESPFQYFVDFEDPELCQAVTKGRREEFAAFGWSPEEVPDPSDPATFERSKLNWAELERPEHARMVHWYRQLIELRHSMAALTNGRLDLVETRYDEAEGWLVVERGPVTIVCNFATQARNVPLLGGRPTQVLIASKPEIELRQGHFLAPPESVTVLGVPEEESYTWSR